MRIHISDARASGYCAVGIKQWFAAHDLDFRDFLKNGIEATELQRVGDELSRKVIAEAQRRQNHE